MTLADVVTPRIRATRMWPEDVAQRLEDLRRKIDEVLEPGNSSLVDRRAQVTREADELTALVEQIERELQENAQGLASTETYLEEVRSLTTSFRARLGTEKCVQGEEAPNTNGEPSDTPDQGGPGPEDAEELDVPSSFLRRQGTKARGFFR